MRRRGLTLIEVLIAVALLGLTLLVALGVARSLRERSPARRSLCKNNLKTIGIALRLYRDNVGGASALPPASGSDFLIWLYVSGQWTDPGGYLCPTSGDDNEGGATLALGAGSGATNACSYAGRRNVRQTAYPGLFTNRGAHQTSTASDDDEGRARFNHADAVLVLYLDGHAEEHALTEPTVGAFGRGGLLDPLGN